MSMLMTQVPFSFPTPRIPLNERSADPLWLSITTTPYMAEPEEFVTVYEGSIEFEEAANAMADECFLYSYQGIFYNMPAQHDLKPPFYCITRGRYIGVFLAYLWRDVKIELWTPGNRVATFFAVCSLVLGEQKVHRAIRSWSVVLTQCNQRRMSTDPPCAGASSIQTIVCTQATSTALKNLQKWKKKPKLNFYCSVTSVPSRQHTQYEVHKDGSISYTLKRLQPPKNAKATINNLTRTAPTLDDVPFSIPEPFDDLPLEVSLDFLGQQKRN
ncbi:hypothetical protein DFH29DRAFT_1006748 [Suillus ampliporus]|nr:hypothetical protein DFH29DRAFT_1006748 [Suillus ampliporus]